MLIKPFFNLSDLFIGFYIEPEEQVMRICFFPTIGIIINLGEYLKQRRIKKIERKWFKDSARVDAIILSARSLIDASYMWHQLVHQELLMWASLGKQVSSTEFDIIMQRRGFIKLEIDYLVEGLHHLKLAKKLTLPVKYRTEHHTQR